MNEKTRWIVGWVMSVIAFLLLAVVSAAGKFLDWEGKEEMLKTLGFTAETLLKIGIVEVVIAILFLIPRTAFVGAILITAYLGGAVVTHVRLGDPFVMPIIVGVWIWIALGLRQPAIFTLAVGKNPAS